MALLTKNISFCDRVCQNVVSSDFKSAVLHDIQTQYGASIVRRHHARMDAPTMARVAKTPHIVCLRSNGNPYLMYMCKYNTKNVCIFVDKKIQGGYALPRMVVVPLQLQGDLFKGTLLDGEMVRDTNGAWVFLINDAWGYCGKALADVSISERLSLVDTLLRGQFLPCAHDICAMQLKRYVKVTALDELTSEFAQSLPYTSRGLLFKPLYRKFVDVLYNFDDSLVVKVQRSKHNKDQVVSSSDLEQLAGSAAERPRQVRTQCKGSSPVEQPSTEPANARVMRVMKGTDPDIYRVIDASKDVGTLRVKSLQDSLALRSIFLNQPITKSVEMRCRYNTRFGRWENDEPIQAKQGV